MIWSPLAPPQTLTFSICPNSSESVRQGCIFCIRCWYSTEAIESLHRPSFLAYCRPSSASSRSTAQLTRTKVFTTIPTSINFCFLSAENFTFRSACLQLISKRGLCRLLSAHKSKEFGHPTASFTSVIYSACLHAISTTLARKMKAASCGKSSSSSIYTRSKKKPLT